MTTSNVEVPSAVASPTTASVDVSMFEYTPSYCEENVYLLCKKLSMIGVADAEGSDLFVVFISNENRHVPLWHQKASSRADGVILWDYHVICIQKNREGKDPYQVWDLDSTLPFPAPLAHYVSEAVRPSFQLYPEYQRLFRVVHAPLFLRFFASDRRHMKDSVGNWISQPPTYENLVAEDGIVHNLDEYIRVSAADMVSDIRDDSISALLSQKFGLVVNESQLESFFTHIC
ncbi:protein N-terminal glutamine amidohydrolase isoform X1 [Telopea speciosissima]|uniref:protein N-terminal glutamine amidohydrolase isoform X1 n=1 Tax=Telopea speciosissima TaxID=54955 RepID=UPI001CC75C81|nr:protein N-terminal glutamine amidohydrolase isoform X1 [Telopea speciosissima]